ncbi:ROK family protein [Catellatospora vulcania]|uniref:ROK family protein n=1 Tax=Catellatospora vulcania TaxID=1460450 RepID=UPI0012D478B3|nr:ROK family protein [Catellatospora vulcania]
MAYLGIDIGGTKVATRLARDGEPPRDGVFTWPAGAPDVAADLAALAGHLDGLRAGGPIEAAGVAVPATLDAHGVVTAWPNRPRWTGVDLLGTLGALLPGARVRWGDDGDLAGLAEADAAGLHDAVYLGVGTGIGGAVVIGSQPVPGPGRGSAELGHMVLDLRGPRCTCGRTGCLQALASGPATLRRARDLRGSEVSYDELATAWRSREPWAATAVGDTCDALAAAAVSLHELLHTDAVVIGGGFAAGLAGFADEVAERAGHWARPGHPAPPVRAALLDGLSSLAGAVLLARLPG